MNDSWQVPPDRLILLGICYLFFKYFINKGLLAENAMLFGDGALWNLEVSACRGGFSIFGAITV
jgi:hypothetical protein